MSDEGPMRIGTRTNRAGWIRRLRHGGGAVLCGLSLGTIAGLPGARAAPVDPDPLVSQVLKLAWEVLEECPPPKCVPVLLGQSPYYLAAAFDYLNTPYRFYPYSVNRLTDDMTVMGGAGADVQGKLSALVDKHRDILDARFKRWVGELPKTVESIEVVDRVVDGHSLYSAKKVMKNGLESMGKGHVQVRTAAIGSGASVAVFPDLKRFSKEEALKSLSGYMRLPKYSFDRFHVVDVLNPLESEIRESKLGEVFGQREMPYGKAPPDLKDVPVTVGPWENYKTQLHLRIERYRKRYPEADEVLKKFESTLRDLNLNNPMNATYIPVDAEVEVKVAETKPVETKVAEPQPVESESLQPKPVEPTSPEAKPQISGKATNGKRCNSFFRGILNFFAGRP